MRTPPPLPPHHSPTVFERHPRAEASAVAELLEKLNNRLGGLLHRESIDVDGAPPAADDICAHQLFLAVHCAYRLRRAATDDCAFRWAALVAAIRCRDALARASGQATVLEGTVAPGLDETGQRCEALARFHQLPQAWDSTELQDFLYDTIMSTALDCLSLASSSAVGAKYPELAELRDQLMRDDRQRLIQYRHPAA
jgi:hypothetical protein